MPIFPYSKSIENNMKSLFDNLSERDRRMYAAVEAGKLNRGGLRYICDLLGCSGNTIQRGKEDLEQDNIIGDRINHVTLNKQSRAQMSGKLQK